MRTYSSFHGLTLVFINSDISFQLCMVDTPDEQHVYVGILLNLFECEIENNKTLAQITLTSPSYRV